jgi:hypothetical protein
MRSALNALCHVQLARAAAPDQVEWRTRINGPDLVAQRAADAQRAGLTFEQWVDSPAERELRATARGGVQRLYWPR